MYYVYILKSLKSGVFYKGFTNDLDRRFKEHKYGKNLSTKNRRPFRLIHVELVEDRNKARELEKFFKSGFGRETI